MPTRARRPCRAPGCTADAKKSGVAFCAEHAPKRYDPRTTSAQRGYGARWQKLRQAILARDPLCVECKREGKTTPATDVDHVLSKAAGGTDALDNLQSLCRVHHNRKTANERRTQAGDIAATIVAGAPGSGKTTYVRESMRLGDVVVDVDALFVAISFGDWYDKPRALLPFVLSARDAIVNRIAKGSDTIAHAWIITSEPNGDTRDALARQLNAEVVVLDIARIVCLQRIASDERRAKQANDWRPLVDSFFQQFTPGRNDRNVHPIRRESTPGGAPALVESVGGAPGEGADRSLWGSGIRPAL